ncbi:hypothetical protein AVEN_227512-1 [Araneus ventricosus]|uniref:Uncharacterized protein n=1 Tax=Araneus ventricosus TaxID=182803 RepID=A0A4Y2C3F3_ARAVE|nr:hypothetical protein AVEN_227512-1 [Araneus ventricosus]
MTFKFLQSFRCLQHNAELRTHLSMLMIKTSSIPARIVSHNHQVFQFTNQHNADALLGISVQEYLPKRQLPRCSSSFVDHVYFSTALQNHLPEKLPSDLNNRSRSCPPPLSACRSLISPNSLYPSHENHAAK